MPKVKLARKSTDTDMTPFVDIAFLILSFFIMATKFKPAEPVPVETPNSVSSDILKEENALLITIDKDSRVFINVSAPKDKEGSRVINVVRGVSSARTLGLTDAEVASFKKAPIIGVPFSSLKGFLALSPEKQAAYPQPGIPVTDSLNNELIWWISEAKKAFAGTKLLYLIKGDNKSKYPAFEGVINALRKNEEFKYNLITAREGAPEGSELERERNQ
jgi:biopolymer transport protein ExbD